ncbi:hypothetical protein FYJ85_10190 [Victivallaceae bacterium BBE-744-WT-12]|uniref:YD repeat-containing protein n=1 Tax=Victivallis lenta TaxID=2606640 RepID=A0A844G4X2_9BACT|nr:hypothetical protein [Victivallis lenta]
MYYSNFCFCLENPPDIAYTHNWIGQPVTVTDAAGTRTFAYNAEFNLISETINGIYNKTLIRAIPIPGTKGE